MDRDRSYTVSRSLVLQVAPEGHFLVRNSLSRPSLAMEPEALPVLLGFSTGATPREALTELAEEWEVDAEQHSKLVARLVHHNLLTPTHGEMPVSSLSIGGFSSAIEHYTMLCDTARVLSYRSAIERHCGGRYVLEIGCGTGIMSVFASRAGAHRVTAIEESAIASLAQEVFGANDCDVDLRLANSHDVSLDEPADVLIHELIGTDPFGEGILSTLADARARLLKPGARLIPYRLEVCGMGFEVKTRPDQERTKMALQADDLARFYGIDLGPLAREWGNADASFFFPEREIAERSQTSFAPRLLTGETRLFDIDFRSEEAVRPLADLHLEAHEAGNLGGLLVYFRAHLDESTVLSTAPSSAGTHWHWDARPLNKSVRVKPGDEVALNVEVRTVLGLEKLFVELA